ncbi:MAG TPA: ABC transporter substrate-binding protein [Steroidobacteraceae bacterium]
MRIRRGLQLLVMALGACCALQPAVAAGAPPAAALVLRIGHFPNLTHVQALIGHSFSREGKGWFESRLGTGTRIDWLVYNAGPSAMEAIFARSLDLTYVGPSPAINAYTRSLGEEIRIVAGALEGGSALVVQPGSTLRVAQDFRGKRIATPQLGNTQDVAARAWLANGGLRITLLGGDAQVIPTENPDQLLLFQQKQLDAVWTVEPWVSRLELEAGGKVIVEDPKAVTTVVVSSVAMLREHREVVRRFVAAHEELTKWILDNPAEAQRRVLAEFAAETHRPMAPQLLARAWPRLHPTTSVSSESLAAFNRDAQKAGILRNLFDLSRLVEKP